MQGCERQKRISKPILIHVFRKVLASYIEIQNAYGNVEIKVTSLAAHEMEFPRDTIVPKKVISQKYVKKDKCPTNTIESLSDVKHGDGP